MPPRLRINQPTDLQGWEEIRLEESRWSCGAKDSLGSGSTYVQSRYRKLSPHSPSYIRTLNMTPTRRGLGWWRRWPRVSLSWRGLDGENRMEMFLIQPPVLRHSGAADRHLQALRCSLDRGALRRKVSLSSCSFTVILS